MCAGTVASAGAVALALAVRAVKDGTVDAALITTVQPGALAVALVVGRAA